MTVEHAHSVDNGVYEHHHPIPHSHGVVEFLDEEHGGYKVPEPHTSTGSATLGARVHHMLVLRDFQDAEVWRAVIIEGTASFVSTFLGTLSAVTILNSSFAHPTVPMAILQGLILSICILAAAPSSGGHVNPIITWTEMLTGHITPVRASLYILAQIFGSIIASFATKEVVGEVLAARYSLGGCYLKSEMSPTSGVIGISAGRALVLEIVLDFFVLFIAYSVALDPPRLPRTGYILAPFIVGGVVGLGIFAGGGVASGFGGAGINPGRCIGPAVAMGGRIWDGQWVFWVGPAVAGVAMALLYRYIPPTHVQVYKIRRAAREKRRKSKPNNPFAASVKVDGTHINGEN